MYVMSTCLYKPLCRHSGKQAQCQFLCMMILAFLWDEVQIGYFFI